MVMEDDALIRIMSSLGLDYGPAERSTKAFEARIASLNKEIFNFKANMISGVGDINKVFSAQLGSMSGSKTILDQFGNPLKTVQTEAAKTVTSMDKMVNAHAKTIKAAKDHGKSVQEVAKKYTILGSEMQRRVSWFMTGGLFYGGINAGKEMIQTISEVEMGVTQIARVMEDSAFVFRDYRNELLQMGVDYGQSFENVQDIALRWAQAGYNVKDSLDLTKTALLALNTAELDASNATESMIGIMSQWQLTAGDLPLVLDKINKTADDFTVTSQDLVDGLLRSSGAAKIMGLSIDQTISLLTVMREASGRTGREVGNALNSILSYVQRPISIKTFESLGIKVFADATRTQFRNVMDIFKDVAAKWQDISPAIQDGFVKAADDAGLYSEELAIATGTQKEWNDLQQRDLSQAAAGVYRRNYFIGMIERLSSAQNVLNNMTDASGYSMRENERTMDTLEKKYESLKTACQELAVSLGDAGLLNLIKGLTDGATIAADEFSKLDGNMQALIFTTVELFGALKGMKAIGGLFGAEAGFASLVKVMPGWTKLIPIVIAAASAIGLYAFNAKAAAGTMSEQDQALGQLGEQYLALQSKISSMASGTDEYKQAQSKLLDIMGQIGQKNPELITSLDDHARITGIDETAIRKLADAYGVLQTAQNNQLVNLQNLTVEQLRLDRERVESTINTLRDQVKAEKAALDYYQNKAPAYANKKQATNVWEGIGNFFYQNGFFGTGLGATEGWGKTPAEQTSEDMSAHLKELEEKENALVKLQEEINKRNAEKNPGGSGSGAVPIIADYTEENLKKLFEANKLSLSKYLSELRNLKKQQYSEFSKLSAQDLNNLLVTGDESTIKKVQEYLSLENAIQGAIDKSNSKKYTTNEVYQSELKVLEHKKAMNQLSVDQELTNLKLLGIKYKLSAEERMDLEEKIFTAEKALNDEKENAQEKRLQNSIDWINKEKEFGRLSAQETLAAWERVKNKQKDFAEAVKEANKGIFESYKALLDEQMADIEKAYNKRIDLIEAEADKQKEIQNEIIKGIEAQEKALDRSETEKSHADKMADIDKEIAYWSVRTSEEARQKLIELQKKKADEQHEYELEKLKQSYEDQKQAAEEKKDQIDKDAKAQKDALKIMWTDIQDIFNENNKNLIANAASTSQKVAAEYAKIGTAIKEAFQEGNITRDSNGNIVLENGSQAIGGAQSATLNTQIKALAEKILNLKQRYDTGDKTAAAEATYIYDQLRILGSKGQSVADQLQKMGYAAAKKYVDSLPKAHTGAEVLSYGAAYLKPGELIFPPTLSADLKSMMIALQRGGNKTIQENRSFSDSRKEVKIDKLVNIEKFIPEDSADYSILARELKRELASMI
jgi:hypothetical protein